MTTTTCVLETHPEHGSCCCQCKYRLRALAHDSFPHENQIGWACVAFAFMENTDILAVQGEDIAYIGNFEHGMCELYEARKGKAELEGAKQ